RIAAAQEALASRELRARLPGDAKGVLESAAAMFDAQTAFGEEPDAHGRLTFHAPKQNVAALAAWLLAQGAERVSVSALEHVFSARNALYEGLERRIGARK
ncbi:MAG TPA: ATP phosphoribosyltransferase, partial [Roseiarcus sp.]|nr:ATP phosphoribosyltransferase [Roseiarcus sp.]